jgi:hypothetical protein
LIARPCGVRAGKRSTGPFADPRSPHCRQAGFVAWEGRAEAPPRLAFLSRGFHPVPRRETTTGLVIARDVCDELREGIATGAVL